MACLASWQQTEAPSGSSLTVLASQDSISSTLSCMRGLTIAATSQHGMPYLASVGIGLSDHGQASCEGCAHLLEVIVYHLAQLGLASLGLLLTQLPEGRYLRNCAKRSLSNVDS